MLKNIQKKCLLKCAEISGIYNFTILLRNGGTVVFYHGVENDIRDKRVQTIQMAFSQFEKQIEYLRKNFEIISIDYLYESLINGYKIDPRQLILTFDDGYKNNLYIAAPLLKTHKIPFTIFISTNHITHGLRFPHYYLHASIFYTVHKSIVIKCIDKTYDLSTEENRFSANNNLLRILKTVPQNKVKEIIDEVCTLIPPERWSEIDEMFCSEEPLNWDEVKQLHSGGAIIGSHAHDHAILHENQSDSEIDYQLKKSKNIIETKLGECKYFSFPNGGIYDISCNAVKSVKKNKYLLGFTTVLGETKRESNHHILPRVGGQKDLDILKLDLHTRLRYKNIYSKWCVNY